MAEDLNNMLIDGAQSAEDENRLTGNMQDASVVDPAGTVANPEGSTPTGAGTDNTGTEVAPESLPPATNVTTNIPGPTTPEGGGSGGLGGTSTTTEAPQQPTVEQTAVAQDDPNLGTATPLAAAAAPEPNPGLTVDKSVNGVFSVDPETGELIALDQTTVTAAGQVVGYLITVVNTGDQDLTGVVVSDPLANYGQISLINGDTDSDGVLDVGETWIYQAYHQFTQDEIDADGNFDIDGDTFYDLFLNTATVDTDQTGPSSDTAELEIDQIPAVETLKIGKVADGELDEVGDIVTYSITVQNDGNVTVYNVDVFDPRAITTENPTGKVGTIAKLEVGETSSPLTFEYSVTQADLNDLDGYLDNTATATGNTKPDGSGESVTDDGSNRIPVDPDPVLETLKVGKVADGELDEVGDIVTYSITVQNDGNVTVYNVDVFDPRAITTENPTGKVGTIAKLEVGETSSPLTFEYSVTQADLNDLDGYLDNTATATGNTKPDGSGESVTDDGSNRIPVDPDPVLETLKVGKVADGELDEVGDIVTYSITVQNDGNVTVYNVDVFDPRAITTENPTGKVGTIAKLEVGETSSPLTFEYSVTQADLNDLDGYLDNTATATGNTKPDGSGESVTDDGSNRIPVDPDPVLETLKVGKVADGELDEVGDIVTYSITVQNDGNVTVYNVDVFDPRAITTENPTGKVGTIAKLEVGETSSPLTFEYSVTQADLNDLDGYLDNTATATGNTKPDGSGESVTDDGSNRIPVDPDPVLETLKVGKVADGELDEVGDIVTYSITVQNDGNVTVYNVDVFDPRAITTENPTGKVGTIAKLEVGETSSPLTFEYSVTQADLNDLDGYLDNTATATGNTKPDGSGESVTDDGSNRIPVDPDPVLETLKVGKVADGELDEVGDIVTYSITVQNDGNVTVYNVDVFDPRAITTENPTGKVGTIAKLEVGETSSPLTFEYSVTQADLNDLDGYLDNTATATGNTKPDGSGESVTDDGSNRIPVDPDPVLETLKVGKVADGELDEVGDIVTYSITVQNDGNVTVYNVDVFDPRAITTENPTGKVGTIAKLEVGETSSPLTFEYSVTQADLNDLDGYLDNTATATGNTKPDGSGESVTDDGSNRIPVDPDPVLETLKVGKVADGELDEVGDIVTYSITVQNDGNVTVYNVDVFDPRAITTENPTGKVGTIAKLEVGETSSPLTFEYSVTQADLNDLDGYLDNTATATGNTKPDGSGESVTDDGSNRIPVDPDPVLETLKVGKVADGELDEVGDIVTYSITVQNDGNVTVYNVDVFDPRAITTENPTGKVGTIAKLEVGETSSPLTFEYSVTQADLNDLDGYLDNTATATGNTKPDGSGESVTDDGSNRIPVDPDPVLETLKVGKVADGELDEVGDIVTYSITVQNDGNVTVYNVDVFDPRAITTENPTGKVGTIAKLEVGETSSPLTFEYSVTQADLNDLDGYLDNTATATGNTKPDGSGESVTDDGSNRIPVDPDPVLETLKVGKVADGELDEVGDIVTYSITVQNDGNVTVYNVDVFDPRAITTENPTGKVGTIAKLEVGETSSPLTFEYSVTQADLNDLDGYLDNTATATGNTKPDGSGESVTDDGSNRIPSVISIVAALDDEGLEGGVIGGLNDLSDDTVPATQYFSGVDASESTFVGTLYGTGISFKDGSTTFGSETVNWSFDPATQTLTAFVEGGSRGKLPLFELVLSGSDYKLNLLNNVLHSVVQGEQSDSTSATLVYTDISGVERELVVVFNDDSAELDVLAPTQGVISNSYGAVASGTFDAQIGADVLSFANAISLDWLEPQDGYTLIREPGTENYYAVKNEYIKDGSLVNIAGDQNVTSADFDALRDNPGDNTVGKCLFVVELNEDGTYQFTLIDPVDDTFRNSGDIFAQFQNNDSPEGVVPVPKSSFNDQFSIDITGYGSDGAALSVKVSKSDLGVGANAAKGTDTIRFTPTSYAADKSTVIDFVNIRMASEGSFQFERDTVYLSVKYVGDSSIDVIALKTDSLGNLAFDVDQSRSIEYFEISLVTAGDGVDVNADSSNRNMTFKIDGVSLDYRFSEAPADYQYDFKVNLVDADGDIDSATFSVLVDGNSDGVYTVSPIALDLDRDGHVQYESASEYGLDTAWAGFQLSAWVGAGDGFLVYDYNNDGQIAEAKEFVFTMWGDNSDVTTDMQALAAYFDSNKDGVLDSQDDSWDSFGVWQDLNVDGIQQEGEFASLADWGIESIALNYDPDSQAYTAADGDVQVYGQMTVSYSDGSTGLAEDMAFAVQSSATSASEPAYPVDSLVTSYLETIAATGDTDGNGDLSVGELAYGLDDTVSQFIESYGYSVDDHAAIQQEVLNELAHELNDLSPDDGIDIAFDATGDANGADVLAALDDHFMDIYDAHMTPAESYDDPGSMV